MKFLILIVAFLSPMLVIAADAETQVAKQAHLNIKSKLDYLLALPKDYEQQESWPLILFLHGAGERGDDIERVKVHGPPKLVEQGQDMPFIVVSPQCPKDEWWSFKTSELDALLNEITENYKVDTDRIYITGLSMGGFGTWSMITRFPYRFAAAAPICGGGDRQFTKYYKHLPVWAFHGDQDQAVPVERSVEMVESLKKNGGDPKLTIYPGVGHDSWTETYNNSELYDWFLQHKRQEKPQKE